MAKDFLRGNDKLYVLWGSVSSGKTVSSAEAWAAFVERTPHHYPLAMMGKTERTLEANVLDPLAEFLGSKYKENRGRGLVFLYDRKIRIYGANDTKAESKIRGKTLYAWYGDEITTWPESFFMMALSRLRIPGAKAIMSMNPEGPYHWFHKQIIERAEKPEIKAKLYHFLMDDNPHLSQEYKDWISVMYPIGTVWHKRWILGQWAMAEGAIYPTFQDAVIPSKDLPASYDAYVVGCDPGATNPFVYMLLGRSQGIWYLIQEHYHDSAKMDQKVNRQHAQDLGVFLAGRVPRYVDVDPSRPEFILELRREFPQTDIRYAINDVLPGIQTVSQLLYQKRLKIADSCKNTVVEMANYVWDAKASERGEDAPLKKNDHCMDALRYAAMRLVRI